MAQLFETLCMMLAFKESHSLAMHYCRLVWDVRSLSQEIEFLHHTLFVALSQLDRRRLHIVLLYYVLEKTDEEINGILHMSSRSLVQYHRKAAIRQLQQWMGELEDEYDLL